MCGQGRSEGGKGPFLQWCHFLPVPLQLLAEQQQREEAERKQAGEEAASAKKSRSTPDEEEDEESDNAEWKGFKDIDDAGCPQGAALEGN